MENKINSNKTDKKEVLLKYLLYINKSKDYLCEILGYDKGSEVYSLLENNNLHISKSMITEKDKKLAEDIINEIYESQCSFFESKIKNMIENPESFKREKFGYELDEITDGMLGGFDEYPNIKYNNSDVCAYLVFHLIVIHYRFKPTIELSYALIDCFDKKNEDFKKSVQIYEYALNQLSKKPNNEKDNVFEFSITMGEITYDYFFNNKRAFLVSTVETNDYYIFIKETKQKLGDNQ